MTRRRCASVAQRCDLVARIGAWCSHDLGRDSIYLTTLAKALDDIRMALVSEGMRKPKFAVEEMDTEIARIFTKLELSKYPPI